MRYLLDTNVCVDFLNGRYLGVVRRIQAAPPESLAISVIAVAELRYGADRSARAAEDHRRLDELLAEVSVLDFDLAAAATYGRLRTQVEREGTPIGPNDMLIAAQALAHDLILVTDNVDELRRIDGLVVDNWRAG